MTKSERRRKIAFLQSYKWILLDIEAEKRKLENIEDRLLSVRIPAISDMPRGGVPVTMDEVVLDKINLELSSIPNAEAEARRLKESIEQSINIMIDPRDRTILKLKFLHDYTHEQIAEYIHYSVTRERVFYEIALDHYVIPDTM